MEIDEMLITRLKDRPGQLKLAMLILRSGLSVDKEGVHCGDIDISAKALAKSAGVDWRTITATVDTIVRDPELSKIFLNLRPTASYIQVASVVGWHVISVTVSSGKDKPGVLANIIGLIGDAKINIKQVIVEDVGTQTKKAFIITERPLPGDVYNDITSRKIVDAITIY